MEPYWDENIRSLVVQENDEWIVSVTPMIFNDRVLLTHRDEYPNSWTAGFCYDKGGAAHLAALVWDFEHDREPPGYKKVAADRRPVLRKPDKVDEIGPDIEVGIQ